MGDVTGIAGVIAAQHGPALAEAFGDVAIDPHVNDLAELHDRERQARDAINKSRELTSEGRFARFKARIGPAFEKCDDLLRRYRAPVDRAIAAARANLPGPVLRPADDLSEGFTRSEWLALMVLERERLMRLAPGLARAELEAAAAAGDRSVIAAVSICDDGQRSRFFGVDRDSWSAISRTYHRTIHPDVYASLELAQLALEVMLGNDRGCRRALEDLYGPGLSPDAESPAEAAERLNRASLRPQRVG